MDYLIIIDCHKIICIVRRIIMLCFSSDSAFTCLTNPYSGTEVDRIQQVTLHWAATDKDLDLSSQNFTYTKNPSVDDIHPLHVTAEYVTMIALYLAHVTAGMYDSTLIKPRYL